MASISARVRAYDQSVLQNRIVTGAKLDRLSRWLSNSQKMIARMRAANSSRISQLSDNNEGPDNSISIQKLKELFINKEGDLGLLAGSLEEDSDSLTKKLLEDFEAMKIITAIFSSVGRLNTPLDMPSVPHLRKELELINFFGDSKRSSQWAVVFFESLLLNVK